MSLFVASVVTSFILLFPFLVFLFPVSLPPVTPNSPSVSRRCVGRPRAPLLRLPSPLHRLSSPRQWLPSPFHRCVRHPLAFHARPPLLDYRLPIRIAPLLFWILFVRLVPSNSSPPLLDSGRPFSQCRMAPSEARWMFFGGG